MASVISQSMDFFSDVKKYGGVRERIETYQLAEQQNNISPGSISRIRVPSGADLADFRDSTLEFNATCSSTGGTPSFSQPIVSLINRLRVLQNSYLCDDQLEYGRRYADELMKLNNTIWTTSLPITLGVANLATRQANATSTTIVYQIPLGFIMDLLNRMFPLGWINGQLTIEIYWDQAINVIETSGTAPNYVVNNLQFHYANINCTNEYKQMVSDKLNNGGLNWSFKSYDNYIGQNQAGLTGTSYTTLPFKKTRALSNSFFCIPTANINNPAILDKFITYYNASIYNSARWKVNAQYYPSDRQQNFYESFLSMCEVYDIQYMNESYLAANWLAGTSFQLGQTFTSHPKHLSQDEYIQGVNVAEGNSNIISEVIYSGTIPALQSVYYFLDYYAVAILNSSGNISIVE